MAYWFVFCPIVYGQGTVTFQGVVSDSTSGKPLEMASVIIQKQFANKVLGFTNSNTEGGFTLKVPYDSIGHKITARLLGYYPKTITLPSSKRKAVLLEIALSPNDTELHEVVVEGRKAKVTLKGDTTAYDVGAFAIGSERSIEELLKKMPGFEVTENGKIFFKGKEVSKVLLDGDDLLGKDYALLTRNARPDLLEEIQAIENYHENPILKGIEGGTGTVIDLKIREDRKKALFGNVEAHYGLQQTREAKLNAFSFLGKKKSYFYGSHNNIGNANGPTIQLSGSLEEIRAAIQEMRGFSDPLLPSDYWLGTQLKKRRVNFNNEWVGGGSTVFPLGENTKGKVVATARTDNNRAGMFRATDYFVENPIAFSTTSRMNQRPSSFKGETEWQYMPSDATRWQYKGWVENKTLSLKRDRLFKASNSTENIIESLKEEQLLAKQLLEFTQRLHGSKALVVKIRQLYADIPQSLQVSSDSTRYADFFGFPREYRAVSQQAAKKLHVLHLQGRMPIKTEKGAYTLSTGANFDDHQVDSELSLTNSMGNPQAPEGYGNALRYQQMQFYAGGGHVWEQDWLKVETSLMVHYAKARRSENTQAKNDTAFFYLLPFASVRAKLGEKFSANLRYSYDFQQATVGNLYAQPVLMDFRSFRVGTTRLIPTQSHQIGLNVTFNDRFHDFKAIASTSYTSRINLFASDLSISSDFQTRRLFILPQSSAWIYRLYMEKYFSELGLNVILESRVTQNNKENRVNNVARQVQFTSWNTRIGFGAALNNFGTLGLGVDFFRFATQNTSINGVLDNNGFFYTGYLNLAIHHQKKTLKTQLDGLILDGDYYALLDVSAVWPIKERFSLYLTANNLLGMDSFDQLTLSDIAENRYQYDLLGRQILLGLNVNF